MSITRTAPAPTRATTSVVLTAGLLTIPLSVFTSVESTAVTRKEFLNGNPDISVGRVPVRRDTDEPVTSTDITRMAQADNGTWVTLTDDEIGDCVGLGGGCEIVTFVPVKDASCYLTDGLYQVRPKNDKKGKAATDTVFALLLAGMASKKVNALVRFAMRGAPRYALLTADGDLLLIATADAIRAALPLPDTKPSKAEVAMIGSLIEAIGIETPTVIDDISPRIRSYVNAKAGTDGVTASATPIVAQPIADLNEMLAASIEAARNTRKLKVA